MERNDSSDLVVADQRVHFRAAVRNTHTSFFIMPNGSTVNTCIITAAINPLESRGNYNATSNNTKLVHWPLMGGLLHMVHRRGGWAGPHPFGFNVPMKG